MNSLMKIILALGLGANAFAGEGGDAGNGGNFNEMQFISLGYEALDLMTVLRKNGQLHSDINLAKYADVLRTLRVRFVPSVMLNSEARDGANYPSSQDIQILLGEWDKRKGQPEELFQFMMHETLPLVGVKDVNYQVTAPIMQELRRRDLLGRLSAGHASFAAQPVLLFTEHDDNLKTGVSGGEAARTCAEQKVKHGGLYFFVYCEYLEKTWAETVKEVFPVTDVYSYETYYSRRTHVTRSWEEFDVTREKSTYGLRVYGWALLSASPWKVVASSLNIANGLQVLTFKTEREAKWACRQRLSEGGADFYRAICRNPSMVDPVTKETKFYYEIVTQNPQVQ